MNQESNDKRAAPEAAASEAEIQKKAARRRLLKTGIGVAPVALTLVSRPVLAWHCKPPSGWGSIGTGSHSHNATCFEAVYLEDWRDTSTPWSRIGANPLTYTCSQLGISGAGRFLAGDIVQKLLKNQKNDGTTLTTAMTDFDYRILVAALTLKYVPNIANKGTPGYCLDMIELRTMAGGSYMFGTSPGGRAEITTYLMNNWLALKRGELGDSGTCINR